MDARRARAAVSTAVAGAGAIAVTVLSALVPAAAAPTSSLSARIESPAVVPGVAAADARRDALAMRDDAVSLRRDVERMMQRYVDTYGSRFTPADLAELTRLRRNADRQLASVVITTGRLSSAITRKQGTSQVETARRAALSAWTRARSAADSSYGSARSIMEPQLSLVERLRALGDYTDMMGRFDVLGEQIRTVGT